MAKKKDDLLDETETATEGEAGLEAAQESEDSKDAVDSGADATRDILNKQNKQMIMIPSSEKDKDAVQVGINGYVYNMPRDTWVEVPDAVCEVLNNASITAYTQKKREEGEGNELIATSVRRFPFQSKV